MILEDILILCTKGTFTFHSHGCNQILITCGSSSAMNSRVIVTLWLISPIRHQARSKLQQVC